ncbi:hypothetical protein ACH5RR_039701 [Cinchona calisaya]|uniref:Uncharacterized protein n=1 Tax=Cinchona calisaya TaxID=153742 RepID=A0ABD2XZF9_9GENT
MALNREAAYIGTHKNDCTVSHKPPRLSMENLQRTISDISFELSKEAAAAAAAAAVADHANLPPISEVEDAKCECCGMSEECTQEYISRMREKFSGRLICGLCAEAVTEEMVKNGGKREEALNEHMNACVKFNRLGRAYPVLCQAEAMREILKKNRANSLSPREKAAPKKGGIARSSSCIPAITKEINNREIVN